ncbi:putative mitochondrial protein, partial [Mucuna pruriens]
MKIFNNFVKNMEFIIIFSIQKLLNRITPYELWNGRQPNISYFHHFECDCFILNNKDNLGKFDPKSDTGIFNGYSTSSKAYRVYNSRVYNSRTLKVEESIHKRLRHPRGTSKLKPIILRNKSLGMLKIDLTQEHREGSIGRGWILTMQGELDQFQKNDVWKLVSPPNDKSIIGTKWILRNKLDDNGKVVHKQARLEVIRILLSFVAHHNMRLHQKDALYRLKQAPRAWYENLNDIIFYAINDFLCGEFSKLMPKEFEMSMMGELKFFLGLQIKPTEDGIYIH